MSQVESGQLDPHNLRAWQFCLWATAKDEEVVGTHAEAFQRPWRCHCKFKKASYINLVQVLSIKVHQNTLAWHWSQPQDHDMSVFKGMVADVASPWVSSPFWGDKPSICNEPPLSMSKSSKVLSSAFRIPRYLEWLMQSYLKQQWSAPREESSNTHTQIKYWCWQRLFKEHLSVSKRMLFGRPRKGSASSPVRKRATRSIVVKKSSAWCLVLEGSEV